MGGVDRRDGGRGAGHDEAFHDLERGLVDEMGVIGDEDQPFLSRGRKERLLGPVESCGRARRAPICRKKMTEGAQRRGTHERRRRRPGDEPSLLDRPEAELAHEQRLAHSWWGDHRGAARAPVQERGELAHLSVASHGRPVHGADAYPSHRGWKARNRQNRWVAACIRPHAAGPSLAGEEAAARLSILRSMRGAR